MNLLSCFIKPVFKILGITSKENPVTARGGGLRIWTEFDESANNLIPPLPGTPQISIRTPTETDSLLREVDRLPTPNGLSPAHSFLRNSPPWLIRGSGENSPRLSRSRTSSNGSLEGGSLKEQLRNARIKCPRRPHCYIVPVDALESLITVPNVEKDVRAGSHGATFPNVNEVANEVCRTARKVFAILAYMEAGSEICSLLRDGVSDLDLPLRLRRNDVGKFTLERSSGVPIETFELWAYDFIEDFERIQWWMLAPVFADKEHYELEHNIVLPFIPFETNPETEQTTEGGYSEVYAVRCHPAHHAFWERSQSEEEEPLIAIKKLYSSDEKEFQKEVTILKALGSKKNKHPHLIKLLATYRQDTKYHLLFPYADANLRTYWDKRPFPVFDEATVLWSLKQMAGIASALDSIHNFSVTVPLSVDSPGHAHTQKDDQSSVEKLEELYGRHGDIKPENILWFRNFPEAPDEKGILQVADFGLGRFHGRDSRSKVPPDSVLGSPTYEPPECKLHRPVSRAYDIWSLGCLYLEFITWLLKGSAEIEGFADFRGKSGSRFEELNEDSFFTIVKVNNLESDAVVRDEVFEWVRKLHDHEKCSDLIHDLLDLIMKEVLLTDATKRADARRLFQQLKMCLNEAKRDKSYLLRPAPRKRKVGSDGRSMSTSIVPETLQGRSRRATVTRNERPLLPLTTAHRDRPLDRVNHGPASPSQMRSRTHSTWPPSGSNDG